jgi:hypothetical protein
MSLSPKTSPTDLEKKYGPHYEEVMSVLWTVRHSTVDQIEQLIKVWQEVRPQVWRAHPAGGSVFIRDTVWYRAERLQAKGWTNAWSELWASIITYPTADQWAEPIRFALIATAGQDQLLGVEYQTLIRPYELVFGTIKHQVEETK